MRKIVLVLGILGVLLLLASGCSSPTEPSTPRAHITIPRVEFDTVTHGDTLVIPYHTPSFPSPDTTHRIYCADGLGQCPKLPVRPGH